MLAQDVEALWVGCTIEPPRLNYRVKVLATQRVRTFSFLIDGGRFFANRCECSIACLPRADLAPLSVNAAPRALPLWHRGWTEPPAVARAPGARPGLLFVPRHAPSCLHWALNCVVVVFSLGHVAVCCRKVSWAASRATSSRHYRAPRTRGAPSSSRGLRTSSRSCAACASTWSVGARGTEPQPSLAGEGGHSWLVLQNGH